MKSSNVVTSTCNLGTIIPAQLAWLRTQLIVCIKVRKLWESQREGSPTAPSLFGISREVLAKAVPEAAHLSSYVNLGMAGLSLDTLKSEFATGFQYRPSNKSGAYQTATNDIYLSGFPGSLVPLVGAETIPDGLSISAVQFHMDKQTQQWAVTICSRYRRPKPPAKR